MRGRNRPKGPNPLTRSYESNGPDVKIRGTAQHIADKYAQLARDALAAGDPVAAENYFQHGEHYFRIVSGAQEQTRPANTGGYASRPFDDEMDEGDEDGQGNGTAQNGNAYNGYDDGDPSQQPQPYDTRSDLNQDGRQNRDRFQNRDQRRFDNNGRQDYRRQDQPRQDYQRQDYQRPDYRQDRQANRQDYGRQENRQENRQDYRQERGDNRQEGFQENRQENRQDGRQESRQDNRHENRQDGRVDQGRYDNGRVESGRGDAMRSESRSETRQEPRSEARPERAPRSETARTESAPRRERRRDASPVAAEDPAGLPAFLMAPARPVPAAEPPVTSEPESAAEEAPATKPRRRRRPRFESVADEGEARTPSEDAATE
ncbi:DUF4167 domain-containing protein [Methylobacterium sp. J-030]|uniref:DUF4167 domain-containing protein n=1 Tax=Methylobacterium sp. J-030 TaxID=2836627 RepID=UPI001FBC0C74|nr:DUF4167 domain-containing protein [Methylobacterium sp. J-030]MCJ2070247.1 DUF4167 domain-containing protein [Methylobacterium sp. J-030]